MKQTGVKTPRIDADFQADNYSHGRRNWFSWTKKLH